MSKSRQLLVMYLCTILLALCMASGVSAQDWEKVQFHSIELGSNIWMLHGAGGNHVLSSSSEGSILVDTDYAEVSEKLLSIIDNLAGDEKVTVLNTHWHFDHVGGNKALKQSGATILAHENVRSLMISGQYLAVIDHEQPPAEVAELPDRTFSRQVVLHQGDESVTVFHVPNAHTNGDAMVFFQKANVLHTGDVVFFCGYPFIDINSGGTIDGLIEAVKVALTYCNDKTQVVPGHGPVTDKKGLEQYLEVLAGFRQAVAQAKLNGMTLEEVLESDVTVEVDKDWDNKMFPSAAFKELVYRSLP